MKQLISIVYFFIFSVTLSAQLNTDSLRGIIESEKTAYSQKMDAAVNLVKSYHLSNFDLAILESNRAIVLARKNGDSSNVAALLRLQGVASYFKGKYDIAATDFYTSISIFEKRGEYGCRSLK